MILLLDALLKVSAILLVGLLAALLLRRSSAAMRHLVLLASMCCAAAAPMLTQVVPAWNFDRLRLPLPAATHARVNAGSTLDVAPVENVDIQTSLIGVGEPAGPSFSATEAVVLLWVAGMAVTMGWLVSGLGRLAWMARRATPVTDARWVRALHGAASRQGLLPPLLLHSPHPSLVATWGAIRPKVIVPVTAMEWTDDWIRVVLDHELAHIRRRDWLIDRTADIMRCVFWLTPLSWLACRRLRQESEQACDDVVLKSGVAATAYASHLLELARAARSSARPWLPATAMARPSSLERRIRAMLSSNVNRKPVTPLARWATVALLLALSLPVITFDALGQARFATVSGIITDESGGVLVDATVSLANVRTGARYEVRSNESGAFEFTGITAGYYDFAGQRLGFEPVTESLTIGVGETLQKDVALRVSSVQETITVGPEPPAPDRRVVTAPPPAPRPCPNPAAGGCLGYPVKTRDVRPIYPPTLADAGVVGKVIIQGVIGIDGRMKDMRVVSSPHADLEQAALDAVGQWEFTATTLNGRAIETRITVDVGFATVR